MIPKQSVSLLQCLYGSLHETKNAQPTTKMNYVTSTE